MVFVIVLHKVDVINKKKICTSTFVHNLIDASTSDEIILTSMIFQLELKSTAQRKIEPFHIAR